MQRFPWFSVRTFAVALMLAASSFAASSSLEPAPAGKKAPKPADPAMAKVADVPGLPRVLLIGDSISIGYTLPVRAKLKGVANVHRPAENCGDTARGVQKLDRWLGEGRWDVIHFNFGLHDLKYLDANGKYVPPDQGKQVASPERYEENLRLLVARLKQTGAKLIFGTTTPVPSGSLGRIEGDEKRYNDVASKVMKETGVVVDDLHGAVTPRLSTLQLPKNVHFTDEGYEVLADRVMDTVKAALPGVR